MTENIQAQSELKCHPRAKDSFIISMAPMILFILSIIIGKLENKYDMRGVFKTLLLLFLVACIIQPLGVLAGIIALYQLRKESSYYGKGYAIAGITISVIAMLGALLLMFPEMFGAPVK